MHRCIFIILILIYCVNESSEIEHDCNTLRMGQYLCPDPNINHIDPKTQQIKGCTEENKAKGN